MLPPITGWLRGSIKVCKSLAIFVHARTHRIFTKQIYNKSGMQDDESVFIIILKIGKCEKLIISNLK